MHLDKYFTVTDETALQIKNVFKYIGGNKEIY